MDRSCLGCSPLPRVPRDRAYAFRRNSAFALLALASPCPALAQSEPPGQSPVLCITSMEVSAASPILPVVMLLGEDTTYDESGLFVPEPIPLYVVSSDSGELLDKDEHGDDLGVFLDSSGRAVPQVPYSDAALYLPPRDLAPESSRVAWLVARLRDEEAGGLTIPVDEPTVLTFRVDVQRGAIPDSFNSVKVEFDDLDLPEPPPECEDAPSGCCTYIGGGPLEGEPIMVEFLEEQYPTNGMITNEMRVIKVTAWDKDGSFWECGVPPDCDSTHPASPPPHLDELEYTWTITEGETLAEIVHQDSKSSSIVLRTHDEAGKVVLRVTVSNVGGAWSYPDIPKSQEIEIQVYDFAWIDQANARKTRLLPKAHPDYQTSWDKVGLSVSTRSLEGDPLTGCTGGTEQELFEGQHTADPDPSTYRLEIDAKEADPENAYKVRVRTRRAVHQGGSWTDVEPYDEVFETVSRGTKHRLSKDFRLVSNSDPGHSHPGTYDDEVCGTQTILVELGDWVEAELLVKKAGEADFQPVSSIELPVERPWSEQHFGWPDDGPRSILSFPLRLTYSDTSPHFGDATKVVPHGTWAEASERMADQVSEDFAQTGMICTLADHRPGRPLVNSLFVHQPSPANPVQAGVLRLKLTWASVDHILDISIDDGSVAQQVAIKIVDAISPIVNPQGAGNPIVDYWRFRGSVGHQFIPDGFFVFVARGMQDVGLEVMQEPTNLDVDEFVPSYTSTPGQLSPYDVAEFAANNRLDIFGAHGQPQDDKEVDVLIMNASEIWEWDGTAFVPNQGWAYHAHSLEPDDPRWNAVVIIAAAGNGSDLEMPLILGHEVGHYLLKLSTHSAVSSNLMYSDLSAGEVPGGPKRLSSQDPVQANQIVSLREPDTPRPIMIRIPERRR